MSIKPSVYLASKSVQRKTLLAQIGLCFVSLPVIVDESPNQLEKAEDYVLRLSVKKAKAGWQSAQRTLPLPVIGSDTCIAIDGLILTKPLNIEEAKTMLRRLSGRSHEVLTGVAVVYNNICYQRLSKTQVSFKCLSTEEIDAYLTTKESLGRAGAYAIQGMAAKFITNINGSYSGVMGLPLYETSELLNQL